MSLKKIKNILHKINESSISFPHKSLNKDIWDFIDGEYILKEDVRDKIIEALGRYPKLDLLKAVDNQVRIIGSICTNLYDSDSDIDIHLVLPKSRFFMKLELLKDDVMQYYKDNRDAEGWYVRTHPFEVYVQDNPKQDLLSDGVYDLMKNKWIKKPELKDLGYNPYEVYKDVLKTVSDLSGEADKNIGNLRRDIIDYETVLNAIKELPKDKQNSLKHMLQEKLDEIELDIRKMSKEKEYWRNLRRKFSPTEDELETQIELSKNWKDMNAVFKLINKYLYMKFISNLEKIIEDGEITPEEIKDIKGQLIKFMEF